MSFDELKKLLHGSESLANYDAIVEEYRLLKETLANERAAHEETLANERVANEEKLAKKDRQIEQLSKRLKRLEDLRVRYPRGTYTLEEYEEKVSKGISDEVERRIKLGVQGRWVKEKFSLVDAALADQLALPSNERRPEVTAILDRKSDDMATQILNDEMRWPPWFKNKVKINISNGVQMGLNSVFWDSVNSKVKADVEDKVQREWPEFVRTTVTPKFQGDLRAMLTRLNGSFDVGCNKCGHHITVSLTPDNVAALIRQPFIPVQCLNPSCHDFLGPHNIQLSLGDVVLSLISN